MRRTHQLGAVLAAMALATSSLVGGPVAQAADLDSQFVGIQFDTTLNGDSPVPYVASDPPTVQASQVFWLTITMRNTGTVMWGSVLDEGQSYASLMTRNPDYDTTFGTFFISGSQGMRIATGDTFDFRSGLRAPATPGTYTMTWQMVPWLAGPFTGDWTTLPFFGPQVSVTIKVVSRTDSPPPAPAHVPGLVDGSDVEYVGSFTLPDVPGVFDDTKVYFASGITLRTVGGETRMILGTGTYHQSLYEVAVPTPVKIAGSDLSGLPEAPLRTVFGAYPDAPAGPSGVPPDHVGTMWYDQSSDTLYWSTYVGYLASGIADFPVLQAAKLSSGNVTLTGSWTLPDSLPATAPAAGFFSGVTGIPPTFANLYTGGKTIGMGFGGAFSTPGISPGPSLAAVSGPAGGGTLALTPIYSYYHGDFGSTPLGLATRDGNYFLSGNVFFQPSSPWLGYWTRMDTVGSGVFIDLPDKKGYMAFIREGTGRVAYDLGGYVFQPSYQNVWNFYDWATLGKAATGAMPSYEVTPSSTLDVSLPNDQTSADQIIAGSCFDPTTRLLYVYSMYTVPATYGNRSAVHVYYIKGDLASIKVTTPPDKTTYAQGDKLNLAGMKVTATYTDGTTKDVTADVTASPANNATLSTAGTQAVSLRLTDRGVTKTTSLNVSVLGSPTPRRPLAATMVTPQAQPGSLASAYATGFRPGERVSVTTDSRTVASKTADASGKVTVSWTVPMGTVLGAHQVRFTGSSGSVSAAYQVVIGQGGGGPATAPTGGSVVSPTGALPGLGLILLAVGLVAGAIAYRGARPGASSN